ncbi:MAG: PP0621 family protein [Methylophilaceae bacterium]|uniref:PP0621 family protein n=1 Tax=Methylovorus sp. MM2 TaxID=1848038 RepID=UPI0007DF83C2|nr:PP0621 family protein [Methylovorus sp. MM2]OAM51759.1 hypothetical protein A7981_09840 [Methylovorus sp. MM2]
MGKILFIVIALWLIFTILKRYFNNVNSSEDKQASKRSEDMVQCHRCGIHMPKSDSLVVNDQYYCCAEHGKDQDV